MVVVGTVLVTLYGPDATTEKILQTLSNEASADLPSISQSLRMGSLETTFPQFSFFRKAAVCLGFGYLLYYGYCWIHSGHWWGDDFALYLYQAKGLATGTLNAVRENVAFQFTNSLQGIAPNCYPWGLPLLAGIAVLVLSDLVLPGSNLVEKTSPVSIPSRKGNSGGTRASSFWLYFLVLDSH